MFIRNPSTSEIRWRVRGWLVNTLTFLVIPTAELIRAVRYEYLPNVNAHLGRNAHLEELRFLSTFRFRV